MNLIKEKRKQAGMNQTELASKIGVNRATLSKYETGQIDPTLSQLTNIAAALGVAVWELIPDSYINSLEHNNEQTYWNGVKDRLCTGLTTVEDEGQKLKHDVTTAIRENWSKEIDDFVNSEDGLVIIAHCIWMNKKGQAKALKLLSELGENPEYSLETFYNDEIARMEKIIAAADKLLSASKTPTKRTEPQESLLAAAEYTDTAKAEKPPEGEIKPNDGNK